MPPKGKGNNKGPATPPKSAFGKGKFTGVVASTGKKDKRNILMYQGLKEGVMVAYLKKGGSGSVEEEPFFHYDYKELTDNPDIMESLGINAILNRRGDQGDEPMKQSATSSYNYRLFLLIIGEDNNTPRERKAIAMRLIAHFNDNANTQNYQYPTKVKLGEDLTTPEKRPIDSVLMDADVVNLMLACYPSTSVGSLVGWPQIMGNFWSDVERGAQIMQSLATGDEGADDSDDASTTG